MSDSDDGEQTVAALQGAARWLSVHDDLLRGLTHTLSNRVGTIAAAAYMVELQPATLGTTAATLRAESERLETLLHLLRQLPRRTDSVAEPVVPTDATAQALALHEHHPDLRDALIAVALDGDLQPAYVEPGALTMAIVVILGAAHRAAQRQAPVGARVDITISCTTDAVRLVAHGTGGDGVLGTSDELTALDIAAVRWLLLPYGGSGERVDAGAAVTIPTLQAARRARLG